MKQDSLRSGEQGFAMIALMLSVSVLFMATAYVSNQTQADRNSMTSSEMDRARSLTELTNLSNLGRVKGLLSESLENNHTVAIYPKNYFANPWEMVKNVTDTRPLPFVETVQNQIWLPSLPFGGLTVSKAASIFEGTISQTSLLVEAQNIQVSANNPNAEHPFFIESIDLKTARPLDMKMAKGSADVSTTGRIKLEAPFPTGMTLLVKFPGETTFRRGWDDSKHPAGEYTFQVRASGIVHYAELELDGQIFTLGINPATSAIVHQANNIKAVDVVIGEVTRKLGGVVSAGDARVNFDECRVGVEPTGGMGTGTAVAISAHVYSVDGTMMTGDGLSFENGVLQIAGGGEAIAANTGIGCEQKCPYEFHNDFWLDPMTQARFLDLTVHGELDTTKLDYFEPDISALITSKTKGVICSNMELVGQAMTQESGIIPTELLNADRNNYESIRNKNMPLKRFFAYTAPTCERQLIGERTACGCFADDTKIKMGNGEELAIREIRAGDRVWNPKKGMIQKVKRVIAGPEKIPMFKIKTSESEVLVTHQHPFLIERGLVTADQLKIGDKISTGSSGTWKNVTAIDLVPWDEGYEAPVVWNIELEGSEDASDHYVLANGIMTADLFVQESLAKK